ncbi:MAG: class I SAM-dependent RNA methyltransferase [Lentisphaeria bacterium]|nr:class I SAM-dependent RNA methyltransferase [Lentisphaeria bacterium]
MRFAEYFPEKSGEVAINSFSPESLAVLDYKEELLLKNKALKALLFEGKIKAPLADIVPSPRPRAYRTTGKRRVSYVNGKLFFHFGKTHGKVPVAPSLLEPESHQAVYSLLHKIFSRPRFKAAATALNYIILRGSYSEHAVIFNVRRLNGDIVRNLRSAAEEAVENIPLLRSAFVYLDETGSDYYLEAERPEKGVAFKKLCGPEYLALKLEGKKLLYPATVFSQINESILPLFLKELENFPVSGGCLIDLYCGYGLWSLLLADKLESVWGAELSSDAVRAAKANAAFHCKDKEVHYEALSITAEGLKGKLPPLKGKKELILLDPPRKGCAPGVLETVIARRPGKILHMFCGADEILPALKIYQANGCTIEKLIPFDFFPGSMNIEMLAVIAPPQVSRN